MKQILLASLLIAGAGLTKAGVIETLSIDLSPYHAGSVLSGSAFLAGPLQVGDSTPITLTFSDPSDYSPTSLTTTLSVTSGGIGEAERFSLLTFTDLSNNSTIDLMVKAPAQCVVSGSNPTGVPCVANGLWQDHDPARFSGSYTVTAADVPVPEPSYGFLMLGLSAAFGIGRKLIRTR